MGYSKDIYEAVEKKLYLQRREAEEKAEKRRQIFYKRFPRALEIEKTLARTAIRTAKIVIGGNNVKDQLEKLKENNFKLQEELKSFLNKLELPDDYLEVKYKCTKCQDKGYVDGIMCECMKDLLKKESYNKLNKLSPLELCTFESFDLDYYSDIPIRENAPSPRKRMGDILNFCRKYAYNFNKESPSLLMRGSTGLGKTHLSLAIASSVINSGYGVIYGSSQNIVSKLERERFKASEGNNNSEKYFIECDLLIIDDLGTEFSTTFSNSAIYNIVNSRIMMGKPTIISTNLSLKELEKSYTERMVSRIIGNNIQLEFLGVDIRQQKMRRKKCN